MVDGARPKRRAIDRIDSPCAVPIMICSRSSIDNRGRNCPWACCNCGFTPPRSANHLDPHRSDTPTAIPAASGTNPAAINVQYRRCTNNNRGSPINTPNYEVLQSPLEPKDSFGVEVGVSAEGVDELGPLFVAPHDLHTVRRSP